MAEMAVRAAEIAIMTLPHTPKKSNTAAFMA